MRAEFLNCPIDMLTMAETVEKAATSMRTRVRLQHVALNVAKFVNMRTNPILRDDVAGSDLVGIDGMGIVIAARWFGLPVPQRVAGIDLFREVLGVCAREGFRPFLLGATPEVLDKAASAIKTEYPSLQFAGLRDGYFKPEQEDEVVEQIVASKADCLFIGMPTPRKERFLARYRDRLGVPFIMGVGGSFDVVAGHVSRAPRLLQSWGMEWLYRVYQEPGRMWWRYAKTNTLFAIILIRAFLSNRRKKPVQYTASLRGS
jgi:N-acetylglucosaminyldiphosphoundecaprenol N-acetyl-beta-D-mannosaminyltransferase